MHLHEQAELRAQTKKGINFNEVLTDRLPSILIPPGKLAIVATVHLSVMQNADVPLRGGRTCPHRHNANTCLGFFFSFYLCQHFAANYSDVPLFWGMLSE